MKGGSAGGVGQRGEVCKRKVFKSRYARGALAGASWRERTWKFGCLFSLDLYACAYVCSPACVDGQRHRWTGIYIYIERDM